MTVHTRCTQTTHSEALTDDPITMQSKAIHI
jgi:hypothetical protein